MVRLRREVIKHTKVSYNPTAHVLIPKLRVKFVQERISPVLESGILLYLNAIIKASLLRGGKLMP